MNRAEHLQYCKDRALEELRKGDTLDAFASMMSDMGKHKETAGHKALEMGTMLLLGGHLSTDQQMKKFIEGFN